MTRWTLQLCLIAFVPACADLGEVEEPPPEEAQAPPVGDETEALAAATQERPCGAKTIAVLRDHRGADVVFCSAGPGVVAVGERGNREMPTVIGAQGRVCPGDLYRALAPGKPVPREIDFPCVEKAIERPDGEPVLIEDTQRAAGDYCSASVGPSNFKNDHCDVVPDAFTPGYDGGFFYCIKDVLWGWHDRNLAGSLGDEGDGGNERVAACGGPIRFRAWWRWDVGDSWVASLDTTVGAGGWYAWGIYEFDGGEDIDVRFRVDSLGGTHRHTGIFEDW
jgi:hypothetical protein